jgi:hypothetical protein
MPDLDEFRRITHVASGVLKQHLLLVLAHQLEQLAGMGVSGETNKTG